MIAGDPPHRDADRQSDLAVMDANEYKQKRRLERILDAMDAIPDQADKAKEQYVAGEIDLHARRVMVQDAVKDAIWEAWNLLVDHEKNCQRDAADRMRADGGDLDSADDKDGPWPHSEYFIGHPDQKPIGVIPQEQDDDKVVWGLKEFFEMDEFWTESWEETVKPRNGRPRPVEQELTHSVPRKVSWAAALRLKEFLNAEHGMEIQFEEMDNSLPNWGFEEIEEVPDDVEVI